MNDKIIITGLPKIAQSTKKEKTKDVKRDMPHDSSGYSLPEQDKKVSFSEAETEEPSENLDEAVEQINKYVQKVQRNIEFCVSEEGVLTTIKVVDRQSNELIRNIDPELAIKLAGNLHKYGQLIKLEI